MSRNHARIIRPLSGLSGLLFLAVAATQPVAAHEIGKGSILVAHPTVGATPEGARIAAGYALILNEGDENDRLIAASGTFAAEAKIHEMAINDKGVMEMREVAGGLEVPAGGEFSLAPGSYHIMFMDLEQPAREGEAVAGSLTFEKAGTIEFEFSVEAMSETHPDH